PSPPEHTMVPEWGVSSPVTRRSSVVLPAPLAPTRATLAPSPTRKATSSRSTRPSESSYRTPATSTCPTNRDAPRSACPGPRFIKGIPLWGIALTWGEARRTDATEKHADDDPPRPRRPRWTRGARRPRRDVPPALLDHARPRRPRRRLLTRFRHAPRLRAADLGCLGRRRPRHGHVPLGRQALPHRWHRRDPRPSPGHDAPHRAGDHRRLPRLLGFHHRAARRTAGVLVGAGPAGGHHAARALDRDAL